MCFKGEENKQEKDVDVSKTTVDSNLRKPDKQADLEHLSHIIVDVAKSGLSNSNSSFSSSKSESISCDDKSEILNLEEENSRLNGVRKLTQGFQRTKYKKYNSKIT